MKKYLLGVVNSSLVVAAFTMAARSDASTWMITSYSGGSLVNGAMQGGIFNGVASLDDQSTSLTTNEDQARVLGLSSDSMSLGYYLPVGALGGGITGMSTGIQANTSPNVTEAEIAQQQLYTRDGPRQISMIAGQHLMYSASGAVTGYVDVQDISNRNFMVYRMSGPGQATFIAETDSLGHPLSFEQAGSGITLNVMGSSNLGMVPLHAISQITFNNVASINDIRADPLNPYNISYEIDGQWGMWYRLFEGGNTNPTLVSTDDYTISDTWTYLFPEGTHTPTQEGRLWAMRLTPLGAVPEPSSWAMMLVGFFGIALTLRRRPRQGLAEA